MMFLKLFCCRETLMANITIGEIKHKENHGNPFLEVHIALTLGGIRSSTDFLYLQPQVENKFGARLDKQLLSNTSTASSHRNLPPGQHGGPEDKEPLPKRLRDVKKERVILIEKSSALCENVGSAMIDLSIEKGKYKLYYLRIENEQRIMQNSRLEMIGCSSAFSVNKMTTDESKSQGKIEDNMLYDESYSYESLSGRKIRNRCGSSPYYQGEQSSSLDSAVLMNQIQSQHPVFNSQSQSVYSSDQTKMIFQSPSGDNSTYNHQLEGTSLRHDQTSMSQYSECCQSVCSNNSSATYVIKKENDEAMILTHQHSTSNLSRHKRGPNVQNVLEDISNQSIHQTGKATRNRLKQKLSSSQKKKQSKGKENKIEGYYKKLDNNIFEMKSHSFTNGASGGSMGQKKINGRKKAIVQVDLNQLEQEDDELDVRYINDIDSLVPPRYNPDTRTYFKCSIYSPSNRLYTVNEEANSTQSDVGAADQFSSSLMNSGGYRMSTGRAKVAQKIRTSCANSDRDFQQNNSDQIIDEEDEDDETANISESMIMPSTPRHQLKSQIRNHNLDTVVQDKMKHQQQMQSSQASSVTHTRTNSSKTQSKAQSLRGSIIVQKPFSSHFSSIVTQQPQITSHKSEENLNKKAINKFLRETFNGVLPTGIGGGLRQLQQKEELKEDDLGAEIHQYLQQQPGSFVCTGGTATEFHQFEDGDQNLNQKEQSSQQQQQCSITYCSNTSITSNGSQMMKPYGNKRSKKGTLSIEKIKVKSRNSPGSISEKLEPKCSRDGLTQSPVTLFDESNRKVVIISKDPMDGSQVEHCIQWDEETDPEVIKKAIKDVLNKVKKSTPPRTSNRTSGQMLQKSLTEEMVHAKSQKDISVKQFQERSTNPILI